MYKITISVILFILFFSPHLKAKTKIQHRKTIDKAGSIEAPDSNSDGTLSKVWVSDNGDGTYKNPVLNADYSDPDAIRVGNDFYLVSSSFNCVPGLPILHSKDLVNWKIINHAFIKQNPLDVFEKPQHGKGVWAPAIRYQKGEFYIFYPDPDFGIYMIKTRNILGKWDDPILIMPGKGLIDPCPLWDENGEAYLVHGFAGSRAGIKNILAVCKMSADGTKIMDEGAIVYDGHDNHETAEGPKFYKRNDLYYIMLPAGGVPTGYQLVLRSKNIYGPYEEKIVLEQGNTLTNGPHQGAWVETQTGESWFLHFQDKEAYGRVVHLEPVKWINDWPVMGNDLDGDGKGEPVLVYKKPNVGKTWPLATPATSDEFNDSKLGLQWQWHAKFKNWWAFPVNGKGILRMYTVAVPDNYSNMADVPSILLQKFPADEFTTTTKVTFNSSKMTKTGEKFGLIVMGYDYASVSMNKVDNKLVISQTICLNATKKGQEQEIESVDVQSNTAFFRVKVSNGGICNFSYSLDGAAYISIGKQFKAMPGGWIGAKVGLFCTRSEFTNNPGFADVDWFRIEE
jgi:beta-xylosidase